MVWRKVLAADSVVLRLWYHEKEPFVPEMPILSSIGSWISNSTWMNSLFLWKVLRSEELFLFLVFV